MKDKSNAKTSVYVAGQRLLGVKDIMEIMHCGRDKAYALMRRKDFPAIRIGNKYYVLESDLVEWMKQGKR